MKSRRSAVLRLYSHCSNPFPYPGIDRSYYLNCDDAGKLNAFEEYIVRKLTKDVFNMKFPLDLDDYIKESISILNF